MAPDWGLRGSRALVTAASQGIGFGCARALVGEGARVVVNSSDAGRLEKAVASLAGLGGDVHGVRADLRERDDLDRLVDETVRVLGGIDLLVYVTGSPRPGTVLEQSYDDWSRAASLLVVSPSYLAGRVADRMVSSGTKGRMVFLTSLAIREPIATLALSSVCRIAVAGLVRTLARELGPKGIRVNGILPGFIETDRIHEVLEDRARRGGTSVAAERSALERDVPLGRIGTTEELARAVLFLASDQSSYVTGAMLPVDGGQLRSTG
jgi:3-oxoacyl-[acyl-carrier protein] reductase